MTIKPLIELPPNLKELIRDLGWRMTSTCRSVFCAACFAAAEKLQEPKCVDTADVFLAALDLGWTGYPSRASSSSPEDRKEVELLAAFDALLGDHQFRALRCKRNDLLGGIYRAVMIDRDEYEYPSICWLSDRAVLGESQLHPELIETISALFEADADLVLSAPDLVLALLTSPERNAAKQLARVGFDFKRLLSDFRALLLGEVKVSVVMGDIFEGGADLTVLPCSDRPAWTASVQRWVDQFDIPMPDEILPSLSAGEVTTPLKFPGRRSITKFFAYAASVTKGGSAEEIVRMIGESLGQITAASPQIRLVESVLFGTGHGGLSDSSALASLAAGFRAKAVVPGELRVYVHGLDRCNALKKYVEPGLSARPGGRRRRPRLTLPASPPASVEDFFSVRTTKTTETVDDGTFISNQLSIAKSALPQSRGYALERLLNEMLRRMDVAARRPFRRNSGGEQIDAAFELDGIYYLVECRWRKKVADIREIDGLLGQVLRSGKQSAGLFISMGGWSDNVVPLLKQNREKCIILMDRHDLQSVVDGKIDFRKLLKAKAEALNFDGEPHLSANMLAGAERISALRR